jgi:transcriptional regulator with XRE-family HTH domain
MSSVSPDHIRFGKRIKELRLAKGLTQEMLAAKIGVDRSYMGFLERGERNPSLEVILKIAKALGAKPDELLKEIK